MADLKISELTLGTLGAGDYVPIERGASTNYRLNLQDSILSQITGPNITGDIARARINAALSANPAPVVATNFTATANAAAVILKKSTAGTGSVYLEFHSSVGGSLGYCGYASGSDWNFTLANLQDGHMHFVNDGAVRLLIEKDTGNIGIGNLAPAERLDVAGSVMISDNLTAYGEILGGIGNFLGSITSAGRIAAVSIKTTAYTVTATDEIIIGNHATVAFTVTLIAASSNTGQVYTFKNKGAAAMTINAAGVGQLFTTAAVNTIILSTGDSITVASDGATWNVL